MPGQEPHVLVVHLSLDLLPEIKLVSHATRQVEELVAAVEVHLDRRALAENFKAKFSHEAIIPKLLMRMLNRYTF